MSSVGTRGRVERHPAGRSGGSDKAEQTLTEQTLTEQTLTEQTLTEQTLTEQTLTEQTLTEQTLTERSDGMETLVRDYTTRHPIAVPPTATVEQAVDEMARQAVRRSPVVEHG